MPATILPSTPTHFLFCGNLYDSFPAETQKNAPDRNYSLSGTGITSYIMVFPRGATLLHLIPNAIFQDTMYAECAFFLKRYVYCYIHGV